MKPGMFVVAVSVSVLGSLTLAHADGQAAAPQSTTAAASATARDFTGIWMIRYTGYRETRNAPMTPWAQEIFKTRQAEEDPGALCLLPGVPRDMGSPYPVEFIVTPKVVYILHEYQHMVRRILIDGKHPNPDDLEPSFMGHSIGHWEGDTLVVDTVGRNDRTWLAPTGVPHSDQIHVTERIRKADDGKTLQIETETDDPKAFTQKWKMNNTYDPRPNVEIMEYICQENNRAITTKK